MQNSLLTQFDKLKEMANIFDSIWKSKWNIFGVNSNKYINTSEKWNEKKAFEKKPAKKLEKEWKI